MKSPRIARLGPVVYLMVGLLIALVAPAVMLAAPADSHGPDSAAHHQRQHAVAAQEACATAAACVPHGCCAFLGPEIASAPVPLRRRMARARDGAGLFPRMLADSPFRPPPRPT
jgi:hypothetical protein